MIPLRRSTFALSRLLWLSQVSLVAMSNDASSVGGEFPATIREFGYGFNKAGKLCKIDPVTGEAGDEPFEFNVSSDPAYNQKRYEALGELITPYVYQLLNDEGLIKLAVPKGQKPSSFIFATKDALSNPDKLMVLIHGSGVVRAGQWARSLIINDCLDSGTQIPYIQRAKDQGYGVLVLNTNDNNVRTIEGKTVPIKGSSNPVEHANWVWENYVKKANAKKIAVVAHSFGGVCVIELAIAHFDDFSSRVFAVALTDSVHQMRSHNMKSDVKEYLYSVGRNWVSNGASLDKVIEDDKKSDIISVSAGHKKHEMTSWSCIESLFKYIENRYQCSK